MIAPRRPPRQAQGAPHLAIIAVTRAGAAASGFADARQLDMAAVSSMKIDRENNSKRDHRANGSEQQDVTDIMPGDALPLWHVGNDSGFLRRPLFKVIS
jgi:hypothetical protein